MSDRITVRGMRFQARLGVTSEERAEPQPIEVDVVLRLDLSHPAKSDELADTINYAAVYDLAREIAQERSFHLIEALAGAIADAVLADQPVDDVEVRVRKPKAPLPGAFEMVEANIRRRRGGAEA
ncbi:MAG: dihydroneopterin aldolase [Chloroflexota bacterium]|nr:dihydroneopterin aldolase [Chloroflexota bacterium]